MLHLASLVTSNPVLSTLASSKHQLTGVIPQSWGVLTNLTYLRLSQNQLNSTIPSTLGALPRLQYCYLHDNKLSGANSGHTCSKPTLNAFANNTPLLHFIIPGAIPSALGNATSLERLLMSVSGWKLGACTQLSCSALFGVFLCSLDKHLVRNHPQHSAESAATPVPPHERQPAKRHHPPTLGKLA